MCGFNIYAYPQFHLFFRTENSHSPGRGEAWGGGEWRGGGAVEGRAAIRASRTRRAAQPARDARPIAYYVPPRPPASLHGGRRSDVPASALLGTGGYNILTTPICN